MILITNCQVSPIDFVVYSNCTEQLYQTIVPNQLDSVNDERTIKYDTI